eukprot:GDKI01010603.1.p1 GENE.GDKI01010603.1~~GDKI01010603.1.p1  ORF type:complete len:119 (-),score=37.74 GDKI01010603.1:18-374(-)
MCACACLLYDKKCKQHRHLAEFVFYSHTHTQKHECIQVQHGAQKKTKRNNIRAQYTQNIHTCANAIPACTYKKRAHKNAHTQTRTHKRAHANAHTKMTTVRVTSATDTTHAHGTQART